MFKSIKSRLIGISVVVVVAAIAIATIVSYRLARTFLLQDVNVELGQTAHYQSDKLALWVRMQKDIVSALAPMAEMEDPKPALQQALASGKLDLAYIGYADKRMVSMPVRQRPADYDPTGRGWYKLAMGAGKSVIAPPYIGASSQKLVVTFASPVKRGEETIAVTGSDVTLEDVQADLQQIKPTPSGYAFLVNRAGTIIVHPRTALTLKPVTELSPQLTVDVINQATDSAADPVGFELDGRKLFLKAAAIADTDWVLVTAADQGEALQRLQQLLVSAAIALLVVGAIATFIVSSMVHSQLGALSTIRDAMREIGSGSGDLTQRLPEQGENEVTQIASAFNIFVKKIEHVIVDVRESSDSIANASSEIASGTLDLSNRTERTASSLEETASTMEDLTSAVRRSTDAAGAANTLAGASTALASRGGQVVSDVVATMQDIHASSSRISDIIGTIDAIAFQTNILALNAAVEAARAGEQGRGFAVVASEVRALAGRSAEAAKEIKSLINTSVDRVEAGTRLVGNAGQTMGEIVESIQKVSSTVHDISGSAVIQRQGIDEVNAAIAQLDQMTQQNAALVEQSTAAANSLKEQAHELAKVVATFKISAR